MPAAPPARDVIIVGGGLAGLSAAIYLGRARWNTLVVDRGKSMARWEPDVQNYLGFPEGIAGEELIRRGREQAQRYDVEFAEDEIQNAALGKEGFLLQGKNDSYSSRRLLLATGIYHLPPEIEGVSDCLGHSMFFCKDCDGYRVKGKSIGIYGWTNEAVKYALGLLFYSPTVSIFTDGHPPRWNQFHAGWLEEYHIPLYRQKILCASREGHQLKSVRLNDETEILLEALFTTRGDVCFNTLAKGFGAKLDEEGQILVDADGKTSVPGLYAAGCVTPANCQMIIAAGGGAVAAQAISRDLFEESLRNHSLRLFRRHQMQTAQTVPVSVKP